MCYKETFKVCPSVSYTEEYYYNQPVTIMLQNIPIMPKRDVHVQRPSWTQQDMHPSTKPTIPSVSFNIMAHQYSFI